MPYLNTSDIKNLLVEKYQRGEIVDNPTGSLSGSRTVEIIGASFVVDKPWILREPNWDYVEREIQWYVSQSLNVNDIPGKIPKIWKDVATPDGFINSNYGYLLFSKENGSQFENVLNALVKSPSTRQAVAVYTRPSIHADSTRGGMKDFICTNTVQYLIRDGKLHLVVQMRSGDVIFGFPNDCLWQQFTQEFLIEKLHERGVQVKRGEIHWQVGSLHVYEKQFHLLD